jgi:hypothetical protein
MSLLSKLKARSMAVALVATAGVAGLALQMVQPAQAMPLGAAHQAYTAGSDSVIHAARVIRKVNPGASGKTVIRSGRLYDKTSGTRKVVVVNGKRVVRAVGPTIRDHRTPKVTVRDHRATGTVRVRR